MGSARNIAGPLIKDADPVKLSAFFMGKQYVDAAKLRFLEENNGKILDLGSFPRHDPLLHPTACDVV